MRKFGTWRYGRPWPVFTFHSPLFAGGARDDSQALTMLLEQASDEARELAIDAQDMQALVVK